MSWQHKLTQLIQSQNNKPARISIIGVGHPLFGDDYIGCWITDKLLEQNLVSKNIQIISAQSNPENIIGPIVRFNPDHMILIDALSGNQYGEINLIPWTVETILDTYLFSSPLHNFCRFVHWETHCAITLIGVHISPPSMSMEMTTPVIQAGNEIVSFFNSTLNN